METPDKLTVGRRGFLFLAALGTGTAAALATAEPISAASTESDDAKRKARYVESEHVKAFYRVNRYPG